MLKQFKATVHVDGHYTIEDPKCPSDWRGSGCYDITVNTWFDTELEVWAELEEKAKAMVYDYNFERPEYTVEVDAIQVEKIEFVKDLGDRDLAEAGVIEDFNIDWKEHEKD